MDLLNEKIETGRLLMVPITGTWREDIFREFTSDITTWMYPAPAADISETDQFIASSIETLAAGTNFQVVILKRSTGEFLGCSGLHKLDTPNPELGIWIKKSAHGQGYGREAIAGLVNWAGKNLTCDHLVYPVDRRNTPSRKIPESLGGIMKREFKAKGMSGNALDLIEYWIQRDSAGVAEPDNSPTESCNP
jgi:RimJ/RimL family protein N-acetyltransferase